MTESTAWQDADAALGGEYLLVREAPQAAGFNMFFARSTRDGTNVSIRTVPSSIIDGANSLKETDIAARGIQHPNILPVIDAGRRSGTFYWITGAIDGRTLRARLSRGAKMEVHDSLTIVRKLILRAGIARRSLPPQSSRARRSFAC